MQRHPARRTTRPKREKASSGERSGSNQASQKAWPCRGEDGDLPCRVHEARPAAWKADARGAWAARHLKPPPARWRCCTSTIAADPRQTSSAADRRIVYQRLRIWRVHPDTADRPFLRQPVLRSSEEPRRLCTRRLAISDDAGSRWKPPSTDRAASR